MSRTNLYGIIAILFIISGAAALSYQIVWFKFLALFLGNTTYTQTVVLATFMGGLAIGAALWGRKSDSARNPLKLYALLELGIGIYCLLYPWFLSLLEGLFLQTVHTMNLPSDGSTVLVLKFLTSLATLLLPTILMGGTLPILVRFLSQTIEDSGKNVATLYFLNSFGAVAGSLICGFFLIPAVGLSTSIYSVSVINIAVALIALGLSRGQAVEPAPVEPAEAIQPEHTERQVSLAILTAGTSGFAAMVYEVTWVRLLIPILGSSTYSYTLMLVGFITGITVGSWIVSVFIHRIKNLFVFLAYCQLGVGLSMIAALPLYGRIPYYFWLVRSTLVQNESTYPIFLSIQFLFGFALMIIPTMFLGMTLPVASRIASRELKFLGRAVGNVFSINTLGTVVGSLMAGLVLIPLIGIRHAIEIGVAINLVVGMVLLLLDTGTNSARKSVLIGTSLTVLLAYFAVVPKWSQSVMTSGVFRNIGKGSLSARNFEEFQRASQAQRVVYYREGTTATVAVAEEGKETELQHILIINGKADASSKGDLPTQIFLGQLPMMLHPQADTVLVIGLGSGVTLGSILTHPVGLVECVEISPEVIEASTYFEDVNYRPFSDHRTRLYIDDALTFLKLTRRSYDVVVSEPSNPWIAGIGNLFTKEFFEHCRTRLNPRGLMVQWFHLYEMDDLTFDMVLRTFQSVFPRVTIWESLRRDVILIGSNADLSLNPDLLRRKLGSDRISAGFRSMTLRLCSLSNDSQRRV